MEEGKERKQPKTRETEGRRKIGEIRRRRVQSGRNKFGKEKK